ncbi:Leucine Rich repeat [Carpediemonas membranifera]|uniref:Leucine Rich repeat n=1 Tax=Carpediemonas membranifera TaxID=201153 RepID=A0A8J6C128_9EUKA|nr:Leucine Rich repeat [Carpediemonas membranifera]|eukprot:KAG9397161.1 Leucine Rich repeat [Carpediemonas membranifera]
MSVIDSPKATASRTPSRNRAPVRGRTGTFVPQNTAQSPSVRSRTAAATPSKLSMSSAQRIWKNSSTTNTEEIIERLGGMVTDETQTEMTISFGGPGSGSGAHTARLPTPTFSDSESSSSSSASPSSPGSPGSERISILPTTPDARSPVSPRFNSVMPGSPSRSMVSMLPQVTPRTSAISMFGQPSERAPEPSPTKAAKPSRMRRVPPSDSLGITLPTLNSAAPRLPSSARSPDKVGRPFPSPQQSPVLSRRDSRPPRAPGSPAQPTPTAELSSRVGGADFSVQSGPRVSSQLAQSTQAQPTPEKPATAEIEPSPSVEVVLSAPDDDMSTKEEEEVISPTPEPPKTPEPVESEQIVMVNFPFIKSLRQNTIDELRIDKRLTPMAARLTAAALEDAGRLQKLVFSRDCLGAETDALFTALSTHKGLRNLYLGQNQMSDVVVGRLAKSLAENQTIAELNLYDNDITTEGVFSLLPFLMENSSLKMLNLSYNKIDGEGARSLSQAMRLNVVPGRRVVLKGNPI